MTDRNEAIARDLATVGRISVVPSLLRIVCETTGMRFAAVARVTDSSWTACAVRDDLGFGLDIGGQLELETTLCNEVRCVRTPIVIDQASTDPVYRNHPTPRIYGIESYISVPIIRPDGSYFGNLCAIDSRPATVSDPKILGMFMGFAELLALQIDSEERQAAAHSALQTALLDAQATAELREQFIAVLGHDLRNPVTAVAMIAGRLLRGPAPAEVAMLGERLKATSQRMVRLIDDVLDFARGRMGNGIGMRFEPIADLAEALRHVVSELRLAHPGRLVGENIAIDRPLRGDRGRLQQLLSNLLGNALAYGTPDQPVLVAALIDGDALAISVTNHGTPIRPDDLKRVFEPYWRPSSSKPGGGLGLGLYICWEIVKAHGGEIGVTSSAEAGTTFMARLPIGDGAGSSWR